MTYKIAACDVNSLASSFEILEGSKVPELSMILSPTFRLLRPVVLSSFLGQKEMGIDEYSFSQATLEQVTLSHLTSIR